MTNQKFSEKSFNFRFLVNTKKVSYWFKFLYFAIILRNYSLTNTLLIVITFLLPEKRVIYLAGPLIIKCLINESDDMTLYKKKIQIDFKYNMGNTTMLYRPTSCCSLINISYWSTTKRKANLIPNKSTNNSIFPVVNIAVSCSHHVGVS